VKGEIVFYRLHLQSRNRKLGPIPAAYADRQSCPDACVLRRNGCYAEQLPVRRIWDSLADRGVDFVEFCHQVDELIDPRRLWRYGVAGDLPGLGDMISPPDMDRLVGANHRRPVLCYTHKPALGTEPIARSNRELIAEAIRLGFLVNLSADHPAHADQMAELGLAPVVTVLPVAYARRKKKTGAWAESIPEFRDRIAPLPTHTPGGRRIAICPATYGRTTCAECRACAKPREAIIGFPAHGSQAKKAENAHLAARDVRPGWPWTFSEHRSMAEVIADEAGTEAA
jgi:hypothetical protein